MRYLSILLLSIVISSFVLGAAEGLCPRLRYVDTVEWLGADDLGFDLGMPELNDDEAADLNAAEPGKNDLKNDDSLNATGEDVVDDAGVVEETATESGALDELDLTLVGDVTGNVDLALFRSGDVVFGAGSLTAGGVKSQVGASGSVVGDDLLLHLVPLDGSRLYVLDLEIEEGSIRGSYEAIGPDDQLLSGRADNTFFA